MKDKLISAAEAKKRLRDRSILTTLGMMISLPDAIAILDALAKEKK